VTVSVTTTFCVHFMHFVHRSRAECTTSVADSTVQSMIRIVVILPRSSDSKNNDRYSRVELSYLSQGTVGALITLRHRMALLSPFQHRPLQDRIHPSDGGLRMPL
jgi:hypothetical protein